MEFNADPHQWHNHHVHKPEPTNTANLADKWGYTHWKLTEHIQAQGNKNTKGKKTSGPGLPLLALKALTLDFKRKFLVNWLLAPAMEAPSINPTKTDEPIVTKTLFLPLPGTIITS